MAILDLNKKNVIAESRPDNIENRKYLTQEELGTSVLYSKDHSLDHISQYISGMKWTVTYFLQLRNMNDEITQLDPRIPATIQKYHRINKLEIYVQNGIDQANVTNIEFEAVINAGFLPNKHDVVLVELMGGREALFILKEIDLRKYSLHDIYWCTFKLLTFVDTDNANLYNDLIYKTVKEYVYDKNHLLDYSAPVILQSDYKRKLNLKDSFREITQYYFDIFLDNDTCVLCPPTESSKYTDIYLSEFLFSIIESTDYPEMSKIVRIDKDKLRKVNVTIWDVILRRDITMLKRAERNIGFTYNPYTYTDYRIRNYNMLGINFIASVLPKGSKPIEPKYIDVSTYDKYYPKDEQPLVPILPGYKPDIDPGFSRPHDDVDSGFGRPHYDPRNRSNNATTLPSFPNVENRPETLPSYGDERPVTLPEIEDKPTTLPLLPEDHPSNLPSYPDIDGPTVLPIEPDKEDKPTNLPDVDDSRPIGPTTPPTAIEPDVPFDPGFSRTPEYEPPIMMPDNSYVVSDKLYDLQDEYMGILERNLKKYLLGDLCDSNDIDKMINQYHMWSTRDQYYLIPVLLVLIKDSIIHTYKQI